MPIHGKTKQRVEYVVEQRIANNYTHGQLFEKFKKHFGFENKLGKGPFGKAWNLSKPIIEEFDRNRLEKIKNGDKHLDPKNILYLEKSKKGVNAIDIINTVKCNVFKLIDAKYYVYALINPLDNTIFYIGKGQGDRMYSHVKEREDSNKYKLDMIKMIRLKGLEPLMVKIADNLPETVALSFEAILINNIDQLTNIVIPKVV